MIEFYQNLIRHRFFPAVLFLLVAGYVVAFGSLFIFGRLPILDAIRLNRYPLLDPAANFINQDNYIINLDPLKDYFTNIAQNLGNDNASIYLESLNSGANVSINKDARVWPASLAKLPLAIAIVNKAEDKGINFSDEITILPQDIDSRSGHLYQNAPGTSFSVQYLIQTMLQDSDNTAQHMLLRYITPQDMQELIDNVGLEAPLTDPQGKISAKEYTRFFRTLYVGSFINKDHSQWILKLLSQATFKDFLSQGVPSNVVFAHKYGEDLDNKIFLDSGIVYLKGRPYMLTVMLQNVTPDQAKLIMKDISKKTFDYMSNFNTNGPAPTIN